MVSNFDDNFVDDDHVFSAFGYFGDLDFIVCYGYEAIVDGDRVRTQVTSCVEVVFIVS